MHRLTRQLTYANVVATLALIVAVAGGSTAIAVSASKKSDVSKKGNIRAGRVTSGKLANGAVTADKLAGIDIVQAEGASPIATCPAGERLIGGGAQSLSGAPLLTSAPNVLTSVGGWQAGSGGAATRAYALCLKATP
jgi:hypothetical protein